MRRKDLERIVKEHREYTVNLASDVRHLQYTIKSYKII